MRRHLSNATHLAKKLLGAVKCLSKPLWAMADAFHSG